MDEGANEVTVAVGQTKEVETEVCTSFGFSSKSLIIESEVGALVGEVEEVGLLEEGRMVGALMVREVELRHLEVAAVEIPEAEGEEVLEENVAGEQNHQF